MEEQELLFDDVTNLLKIHGLTYKWLLARLEEKGCKVNKVSLSKWSHGVQVSDKAYKVYELSMLILDEYCERFADKVKEL